MDVGALRERVRLERRAAADDGFGNAVAGFTPQFERAANFRPLKGGEDVVAARLQGNQPVLITVRYDSHTREIRPDWRVVDVRAGTVYAIRTAEDMERRGQWLTLMCVAGEVA